MVNSILITNSGLNKSSGGGLVSFNLMEALRSCSTLKTIFSSQIFPENMFNGVQAFSALPQHYGYEQATPFFMDSFICNNLPDEPIDLAQTYACPFPCTVEKLKYKYDTKVVADLAPHNIAVSKEEHIKIQGAYPFPHLTNPNLLHMYLRHLRLADKVVVHSNSSAEYIMKEAKLKELPLVIPHGCYIPEKIESLPSTMTPGNFGALGIDKGSSYLFDAWLGLYHEGGPFKENHQLMLGGTGSGQLALKEEYQPLFSHIPHVPNVSDFYNKISFLIHPSVVEGFGITVLEAMAHARPVIVATGAGASELVTDGHDGFVIPIRDVKAIQDKIIYFYHNPGELERMGKNAFETAKRYSWDIIKREYVKVYEELI